MLFRETKDFAERLDKLAEMLRFQGYAPGRGVAVEFARMLANTTLPLELFREWLIRSPEVQAAFFDMLDELRGDKTGPVAGTGGSVKAAAEPVTGLRDWSLGKTHEDATAAGVKVAAAYTGKEPPKESAQKSEPPDSELPLAEPADVSETGVRGVAVSSLVVSLGEAAKLLGKDAIRTRPVTPKDTEPRSLGLAEGFRGQAVVNDPEGKPLRAVAKFANGEKVVEFLDKRGPLILARIVGGEDTGTVVTICIEFIEPRDRGRVLATLDTLPGSKEAFNFSPFDGSSDPWDKSQTISHPTTVEEPSFGG